MTKSINLVLKAGERLFVNGAVLRFNRKTTVELMSDAVFLLESHVIQPHETHTPLRQIYFAIQTILMDPNTAAPALNLANQLIAAAQQAFSNPEILNGLDQVALLTETGRHFDAMKVIRSLYGVEALIMSNASAEAASRAA
ncbi:flagellar biosynthesis repressor FlbT [Breoghania sp.]|uniref:flagellar biosynthesis repressor FlbT n=1 Tax=Breoghania sp. TaxID=2065378 RepID=UPI0029C9CBBB|nr:flagellar biosynthesis repressor FlbT [Breoghania sp.]